jgi:hypothetical protein
MVSNDATISSTPTKTSCMNEPVPEIDHAHCLVSHYLTNGRVVRFSLEVELRDLKKIEEEE